MVEEVSRSMLTPLSLTAACGLGTISAALGAGLEVATGGGSYLRGNLFIAGIAKSGTGKGRSFEAITHPWFELETNAIHEFNSAIRPALDSSILRHQREVEVQKRAIGGRDCDCANIESEITRLYKIIQSKEDERREPCLTVSDVTKEALAQKLSHGKNEAIASMSAEARGNVDVLAGRYNKKTDESIYLSGYSGDRNIVDRVNRPSITLRRPCLTVLWLLQPDKMNEWLGKKPLADGGLLPRFLVLNTRAEPEFEPEQRHCISDEVKLQWSCLIEELKIKFHDAATPLRIQPDNDVHEVFRGYKNEATKRRRPGGDMTDVFEYASRWAENAWKLALVLHACLHGKLSFERPMSVDTANNAITLMNWFVQEQLALLSFSREKNKSERLDSLLTVLSGKPNNECTLRDMSRRHGFERNTIETLVRENPDKLSIQKIARTGGGRPSDTVRWIIADGS